MSNPGYATNTAIASTLFLLAMSFDVSATDTPVEDTEENQAGYSVTSKPLPAQEEASRRNLLSIIQTLSDEDVVTFTGDEADQDLGVVTIFIDTEIHRSRYIFDHTSDLTSMGYTVRYAPFPLGGLSSSGYHRWAAVLCASDPRSALGDMLKHSVMRGDNSLVTDQCQESVSKSYQIAEEVDAFLSPTFILPFGTVIDGSAPINWVVTAINSEDPIDITPEVEITIEEVVEEVSEEDVGLDGQPVEK